MADSETILISCPECQVSYELSAADSGETVECGCGCQFVVPVAAVSKTALPTEVMILCPSCASVYQLESDALGDNVECQCGTIFEAAEAALPEEEEPASAAKAMIRTRCPTCSAEYDLEPESLGQKVECDCGNHFVVTVAPAPATDNVPSAEVNAAESVPESGPSYEEDTAAAATSPTAPRSQPKSRSGKANRPAQSAN